MAAADDVTTRIEDCLDVVGAALEKPRPHLIEVDADLDELTEHRTDQDLVVPEESQDLGGVFLLGRLLIAKMVQYFNVGSLTRH